MTTFPLKLTVLALFGAMAMASGAQAASLYDDDDDSSGNYSRQSISRYCYENPYDDACDPYAKKYQKKKTYKKSHSAGRCAALIRAVGKRNLVTAFARNSARFAWTRETRFVHGEQYASWHRSRNAHITCSRVGGLKSCVATATPCR